MRQIQLKKVETSVPAANGTRRALILDYGETIREILFAAPPQRGIQTSDAMRGFDLWQRVAPAWKREDPHLLLEEADHKLLLARLEAFPWAFFNEDIAEFVKVVRDAPEIPVQSISKPAMVETAP